MDWLAVFGAEYLIYVVAAVFAVFVLRRFSWQRVVFTATSLVAGYAVARVAGMLYSHVQPFVVEGVTPLIPHAVDNSFPSDHATAAMVLAVVAFFYNRTLGVVLAACAVAIGLARVYAKLHYPVDIAASIAIAVVVTLAVRALLRRFAR